MLSGDLRQRIVAAVDAGQSRRAVAQRFGVSPTTVQNLVALWRESGGLAPRPTGRPKSDATEARRQAVAQLVTAVPDLTRRQIIERLDLSCGERTVSTLLIKSGFTRKKVDPGR